MRPRPQSYPGQPRRLRVALLLATLPVAAALLPGAPGTTSAAAAALEPYSPYQAQSTCDPAAKRGVLRFRDDVLAEAPGTRSLGIVRGCTVGGRSEHKEGRAWDWGVRTSVPSERAAAERVLGWLMATDAAGNRHAVARRLGLQYVIWDRRIWSSYAASSGWRAYGGTSPHTDHVHFSFGWPGALGVTSYFTGKVAPVPAAPPQDEAPPSHPDPDEQDPVTASEPQPPATLPMGPALGEPETVTLDARRPQGVTTRGALVMGQRYLLEAWGSYSYGGGLADAECVDPGASMPAAGERRRVEAQEWRRAAPVDPRRPRADLLDLYVDGVDLRARPDRDTGDDCDARSNVFRDVYVPARTGRATFTVWDTSFDDNRGGLKVRVVPLATGEDLTVEVDAAKLSATLTPASLIEGERYLVTATGTVTWTTPDGTTVTADAECVTAPDGTWVRDRSLDPSRPDSDSGDVLVDGSDPGGRPGVGRDSKGCDPTGHTYAFWVTGKRGGLPATLRFDVPTDAVGRGRLTVRLHHVHEDEYPEPETLAVDAAAGTATTTASYPQGARLRVEADGTWQAPDGSTADAACPAPVLLGGRDPLWSARRDGAACDPRRHAYRAEVRAPADGPLTVTLPATGTGTVRLTVRAVGG